MISHHMKYHTKCNGLICNTRTDHVHCRLCNESVFNTHWLLKRHVQQVHFNKNHCVSYKNVICIPCRESDHTAAGSGTRKINHYHCPEYKNKKG